jgi:hypothetical protein
MDSVALRRLSPHLFLFTLCAAVILTSVVLTTESEAVYVWGWKIPPLCAWKALTGWDCMGCGLTRSFVYMGEGQVLEAFSRHWAGPIFWVLVLSQVPWRLVQIARNIGKPGHSS